MQAVDTIGHRNIAFLDATQEVGTFRFQRFMFMNERAIAAAIAISELKIGEVAGGASGLSMPLSKILIFSCSKSS